MQTLEEREGLRTFHSRNSHSSAGERWAGNSDTNAAISPASGSRPTTAEPLAPSPEPAQQCFEAVLGSSAPLCPGSVGQPQAADRVAQGVGVIQRRQPLWRSNRRWVVQAAIHGRLEPCSQVGIRSKATKPLQQSGKRRSQKTRPPATPAMVLIDVVDQSQWLGRRTGASTCC